MHYETSPVAGIFVGRRGESQSTGNMEFEKLIDWLGTAREREIYTGICDSINI
jgi:hypothetical protein